MFGTLRFESTNDEVLFESGSSTSLRYACNTCRARKLKCGGQKTGCDRCKSTSTECVYSGPETSNRRQGRHLAPSRTGNKSTSSVTDTHLPPARTSENLKRRDSGNEHGDTVEETITLLGENGDFVAPFSPPSQSLSDDSMAFDRMLPDLVPYSSSQTSEEYSYLPSHSSAMSLSEYDGLLDDFPLILNTIYTTTPFTRSVQIADANEPASTALATQQLQNDTLLSQREPHREEQARCNSASTFTSPSPTLNKRRKQEPQYMQPQAQTRTSNTSSNPRARQQRECKCLQTTLSLLEEFENRACTKDPQALDSILAYQKKALNHCTHMVRCSTCAEKSDYMVLLGVVSDKMITSYEQVINKSTERALEDNGNTPAATTITNMGDIAALAPSISSSSSSSSSFGPATPDQLERAATPPTPSRAVSFGCYKVDGQLEWELVVRVLIASQLRQALGLLAHMQAIAEGTSRAPQVSALRMRQQRLKLVIEKVRKLPGV